MAADGQSFAADHASQECLFQQIVCDKAEIHKYSDGAHHDEHPTHNPEKAHAELLFILNSECEEMEHSFWVAGHEAAQR